MSCGVVLPTASDCAAARSENGSTSPPPGFGWRILDKDRRSVIAMTETEQLRPTALLIMEERTRPDVYPATVLDQLKGDLDLTSPFRTAEEVGRKPDLLAEVEVLLTGWGAPVLDHAFLAAAPQLRGVFHAAGSIRAMVTEDFWAAGIPIVSAAAANATPVAEFTLAQILLGLKGAYRLSRDIRRTGAYPDQPVVTGAFGSTVGLLSLGAIGRRVADLLAQHEVIVIAHDPFATAQDAAGLSVELVGIEELFQRSVVLSIHTPLLPETTGLVDGRLCRMLPTGATVINTARGAVFNETELIDVLRQRDDLTAVLDVTWPEPPLPGSALYTVDNVVLTPHIAGALGNECARLGTLVADEVRRFVLGEPLQHVVTQESNALRA